MTEPCDNCIAFKTGGIYTITIDGRCRGCGKTLIMKTKPYAIAWRIPVQSESKERRVRLTRMV